MAEQYHGDNGKREGLTEIAGQDNDGQPNLQGLTLQDRTMTDKLAGLDIAGQTSQACILSELSK